MGAAGSKSPQSPGHDPRNLAWAARWRGTFRIRWRDFLSIRWTASTALRLPATRPVWHPISAGHTYRAAAQEKNRANGVGGSLVAVRTFAMLNDTQLTLTKPLPRGPGPMAARTWPAVGAPSMGRAGLVATPDSDVKAGQVRVKDTRRQQRRWWERRQHGQICSLLHSVQPVNRSACSKRPCIAVRCTATPCDVC